MSLQQSQAPTESPDQTRVGALVAIVVAGSSVLLWSQAAGLAVITRDPSGFLALMLLTVVLQALSVRVYGRGSISVAGIGLLAVGFTFGVAPAVAAALLAAAIHAVRRRTPLNKSLFNSGTFALAVAAGTAPYHLAHAAAADWGTRLVWATAGSALFWAVNIGLLTAVMSLAEGQRPLAVWRERFQWLTLHYMSFGPLSLACVLAYEKVGVIGVIAFALPPALLNLTVRQYLDRTRESVEEIRRTNDDLRRVNEELATVAETLRRNHLNTIAALSKSMEAKDLYTGGHTERVSDVSVALARVLGFDDEELHAIEIGALLHDIGKIGVPERILHKQGPLDEEEWEIMKTHPVISDRILAEVELHPYVRQAARSSHERIDGKGYPDGLAGDAVPVPARIVLVADAFDALTNDRPYRKGRDRAGALAELYAHTGTQFCPVVVAALERLLVEEPELFGGEEAAIPDATPKLRLVS